MAGGDPSRFGALAICTALLVAALAFIAWVVHAGVIVNFISETVLTGFKAGVAVFIGATQLPSLFGITGGHGDFWERMGNFVSQLDQTNATALAIGTTALGILLLGKVFLKDKPIALLVVVGGVVGATFLDAGSHGVKLLGSIPQGLPQVGLPTVHWADVNELLPLAMACFMLAAVETIAIGRMFSLKHGYRLDPNQEFLGLAMANLGAGLGQGFPVAGGMSQSLVNESVGAQTALSGFFSSLTILAVVLFFSDLLRNLPQPVLAAVVLVAVAGLFRLADMKRLWRFDRSEFAIAAAAFTCVLWSGLLHGVLIGAVISLVLLLHRASTPHVAVLGRIPGTELYGDVVPNPENLITGGVYVFRADSAILYFNCAYLRDRFFHSLEQQHAPVRLAIWSLSTVADVDLAGAEMLLHLREELAQQGIAFELADARGPVRESLRAAGLEGHFGQIEANASVAVLLQKNASLVGPTYETRPG
jgi:high affinity sulfate transporter 1